MKALTVRALLRPDRKSEVRDDEIYRFCDSPGCATVYFTARGWAATRADLTVRVGVKETAGPVPVCYCFGYSTSDIRREISGTGSTSIPAKIATEVKAGRCRCETRNPSGACCLGEVNKAVRAAKAERK